MIWSVIPYLIIAVYVLGFINWLWLELTAHDPEWERVVKNAVEDGTWPSLLD